MPNLRIPQHLIVAGSAWLSRIVFAFVQLASIQILIDSLGLESYAIFVLLTGLVGWFMLADFGMGASLQNFISESRAKNQSYDDLIVASGVMALLLSGMTIIALYFMSPYLSILLLKNFTTLSDEQKANLFFLNGSLSIGIGVGGVIYRVWYAEQKGYLSNIIPAIASIIGLVSLLLVRKAPVESRLFLSVMVFLAPTAILPLAALVAQQIRRGFNCSAARLSEMAGQIMKRGFHFWTFSIMSAGVLQIDYIVMSQFLSPHDIAAYFIATKIFGLAFFVYSAVLFALWPIFSEAIAKSEWSIVTQYLKKYLLLGIAFILVCTVLLIWLMPVAVGILAKQEGIVIPVGLILLLGLYQMTRVWTDTFAMVLQSMSDLKPFWIYVPFQVILSIGLQWVLAPEYGLYGIVCGLIASFVLTVIWALPLAVRKHYLQNQQVQA